MTITDKRKQELDTAVKLMIQDDDHNSRWRVDTKDEAAYMVNALIPNGHVVLEDRGHYIDVVFTTNRPKAINL